MATLLGLMCLGAGLYGAVKYILTHKINKEDSNKETTALTASMLMFILALLLL